MEDFRLELWRRHIVVRIRELSLSTDGVGL